jgi:hypothetical protein
MPDLAFAFVMTIPCVTMATSIAVEDRKWYLKALW